MKTALILFEYSGTFTKLLKEKGYNAVQVDKEIGIDIFDFDYKKYQNVEIILSFPPCTHFAGSGARWWKQKDEETPEMIETSKAMVRKVLEIVDYHKPHTWFIENPVGRIESQVPELKSLPKYLFDPYQFAKYSLTPGDEAYTKKTCLWGYFRKPKPMPVEPILGTDKIWQPTDKNGKKLGWNTPECKKVRNLTPMGFATAFVEANSQSFAYYTQGTLF